MYEPTTHKGLFGLSLAWVLGIILVVVLLVAAGWGVKYLTADVRGKINANEQIKSGASRIVNYEHFYNLCASIQANEAALIAQKEILASADPDEAKRIRTNIAGITASRAGAIAQYNADARKSYTGGQFRASDLPYQLNTQEVITTCVA